MSLSGTKSRSSVRVLLPYLFFSMVIIVYSLLTILVTMLVTGSVHVINKRYLHFDNTTYVTVPIAAALIISALIFYVKNAKKIYLYIEDIILTNAVNRQNKPSMSRKPKKPK
mgnify:CR=1 FL=1